MTSAYIPLDLKNKQSLQAFMQAIDDPTNRASLSSQSLPQGAQELVALADDPIVRARAVDLGRRVLRHRHEVAIGTDVPSEQFTQGVAAEGAQIRADLQNKYPEGMRLLQNYAQLQQPHLLAGAADWGSAVANAYVVANAAAYVNAAVATNVVVAAEAVVLAAVVVS